MADAVVEGENEWKKCLRRLAVSVWWCRMQVAYQSGWATALDVLDDAVEDANATADGEEQNGKQGADGADAPCSPAAWLACLCPYFLAGRATLAGGQGDGDVPCRRQRLSTSRGPGFNCDNGDAGEQQDDADGVQRLVESEGIVDGRGGRQVAGC